MCLGKPPSSIVPAVDDFPQPPATYPDVMRRLCARYANLVRAWELQAPLLETALEQVRQTEHYFAVLNDLLDRSSPTITPMQVCHRKAFRLHTAYALSYLCRPALIYKGRGSSTSTNSPHIELMQICCANLVVAMKQYLALLELTNVAIRSWAMIYNGLGSSLVLGTLGEFQKNDEVRQLAEQLLARQHQFTGQCTGAPQKWQSRAMETLQSMISGVHPACSARPTEGPAAPFSGYELSEMDAAFLFSAELDFGPLDELPPSFAP